MFLSINNFYSSNNSCLNLSMHTTIDPEQRFLSAVRWYMSCWYKIPTTGVAKPYNPILAEVFKCNWKFQNCESTFFSEQVSHHPPLSAFYFRNKEKNIVVFGQKCLTASLNPFGNYASTFLAGPMTLRICNLEEDYNITTPYVYVRGVFYGSMRMENAGESSLECKKTGYKCIFDWQEGRQVHAKIFKDGSHVYSLNGDWTGTVTIKFHGKKKTFPFLDVPKLQLAKKTLEPLKEQDPLESRRVWFKVSKALDALEFEKANEEKNIVEEEQRELRKKRDEKHWVPKHFVPNKDKEHTYKFKNFDDTPVKPVEDKEETAKIL